MWTLVTNFPNDCYKWERWQVLCFCCCWVFCSLSWHISVVIWHRGKTWPHLFTFFVPHTLNNTPEHNCSLGSSLWFIEPDTMCKHWTSQFIYRNWIYFRLWQPEFLWPPWGLNHACDIVQLCIFSPSVLSIIMMNLLLWLMPALGRHNSSCLSFPE